MKALVILLLSLVLLGCSGKKECDVLTVVTKDGKRQAFSSMHTTFDDGGIFTLTVEYELSGDAITVYEKTNYRGVPKPLSRTTLLGVQTVTCEMD